jgi:hypothetical protein
MILNPEECAKLAKLMRDNDPSLTPEQIAEGITGLLASTAAQRLRWSLELRERERAAQKANEQRKASQPPQTINIPPEPIAAKDEDLTYKPPQPKQVEWNEDLERQALELAKARLKQSYVPPWRKQ